VQPFTWALALTVSRGLLGGRRVKQVAPCAAVLMGKLLLTTGTLVFV
jgi:hypothetical protein